MSRIFFNCKKAQEFLRNNNYVYTVRLAKRRVGKVTVYFGRYRVAKGVLEKVEDDVSRQKLEKYVHGSGFETVDEWFEKIDQYFLFRGLCSEDYRELALYKLEIEQWIVTPKQLEWFFQ